MPILGPVAKITATGLFIVALMWFALWMALEFSKPPEIDTPPVPSAIPLNYVPPSE